MRAWTVAVGGLFLAACFSKPADVDWDAPPAGTIDASVDAPSIDGPMPDAMLTPANLTTTAQPHNFGDVTVGQQSSIFAITIRNSGEQTSGTIAVSASDATDFEVVPTGDATDCDGQTLDQDETCVAQVRFTPQSAAPLSGTLDVTASPGNPVSIDISGMGLSPGNLEITAGATLDFATIELGATSATKTMTVHNLGGSPTASLTVSLGDATNYTKLTDNCGGAPLGAGASCSIDVHFNPTVVGSLPAQLSVRESVNVGVSSALTGTGSARIALSKTGTGIVNSSPGGISCGTGCASQTGTFMQAPVSLTAQAATGFRFGNWSGACSGTVPDACSITPTQALTSVGATFVQTFDLTVATTGAGTIVSAPSGINCGDGNTSCAATYDVGTSVLLTAAPDNGDDVYAWTGISGCAQGAHTCQVDMTQVRNVSIEFRPLHTLTVTTSGSGTGTVNATGIACPGSCSASYFEGAVVPVSQTPAAAGTGYQTIFGGWGGACSGTGACSVTMSADKSVSAAFTLQYQASITIAGSGTGTVNGTGGFSCATGTCTHFYDSGSSVPLSNTPTSSRFSGYSGSCSGTSCTLTMTAARSVTATFIQQYTLTVAAGTSGGTVSATGISCGDGNTDCTEPYDTGALVTLTATPDNNYEVYAWNGVAGCAQAAHSCNVTMSQAQSVTVDLRLRHTLTVTTGGTGTGTVTGSGIACPGACSATYFDGTVVPLTQAADSAAAGSQIVFGGWGGACSGTGSCSVTMNADKSVDADFTLQYQVSVTIAGTGSGSVSGPGAFSCASGTCTHFYDSGSAVTLTGNAGSSTSLIGFSGDCTGSSCGLTMSAARVATATFHAWDCTPNATVCDDPTSHYTECDANGYITFQMDCPLSCASGVEKCLDVDPSNGLASQLDLASMGPDTAFAGSSSINTTTGVVFNGANSITVPSATVNGIRVLRFNSLSIAGTLKVSGSLPLALVVNGNVTITGTLDVSADGGTSGPGIRSSATTCDGAHISITATTTQGGPGAGRYSTGGRGGDAAAGTGTNGGAILVDNDLVPLQGGCKGGTSTRVVNGNAYDSVGGGGGGSVQIVSRTIIALSTSGVIDASGGGGVSGVPISGSIGGGGGGSGGGVLLEAPQVTLNGANVVVSTKGGGGAAAGNGGAGMSGADGGTASTAASGGTNGANAAGGAGGTETLSPTAGGNSATGSGGGGGGSSGQAHFNTTAGTISPQNGAVVRSHYTTGSLPTRMVP